MIEALENPDNIQAITVKNEDEEDDPFQGLSNSG